jgi:hypothetical protein
LHSAETWSIEGVSPVFSTVKTLLRNQLRATILVANPS